MWHRLNSSARLGLCGSRWQCAWHRDNSSIEERYTLSLFCKHHLFDKRTWVRNTCHLSNSINFIFTWRVCSESISHSVLSDSLRPHGPQPNRLLCPWNSPGKNTGVGGHALLQGICLTQGLNLGLLHCILCSNNWRRWVYSYTQGYAVKAEGMWDYARASLLLVMLLT